MRIKSHTGKIILIVCLVLLSCGSAGKASYLSGKAWLAQILLNRAWEQSQYSSQAIKPWPWADIAPVAKLNIPSQQYEAIVLASHSGQAMAFGPGLIQRGGSYILAGHRDSHFNTLKDVGLGDEISLTLKSGEQKTATIQAITVVDTNQQNEIIPPEKSIVLITCYPFDAITAGGPLRYVITAY